MAWIYDSVDIGVYHSDQRLGSMTQIHDSDQWLGSMTWINNSGSITRINDSYLWLKSKLWLWIMTRLHDSDQWFSSTTQINDSLSHPTPVNSPSPPCWIFLHNPVWLRSMTQIYGSGSMNWIRSMTQICDSDPWLRSVTRINYSLSHPTPFHSPPPPPCWAPAGGCAAVAGPRRRSVGQAHRVPVHVRKVVDADLQKGVKIGKTVNIMSGLHSY